ncbi:probable gamma-secretase subunit PEN-2 [Phoenix dactylifera]|uniref:Probable gamma-secretase subunit PEN-2 n=1 Tax=Phoenix dactylifera TaxID=42345 RepID=A0A8B7CAN4_PHODC|nr:probable gamma-secretase subunit PEN-2 [Phoenix dactylifera]
MEGRGQHEEDEERRHLGGSGLILRRDAAGSGGGGGGGGDSDPSSHQWPTVDGPLGLSEEESVAYARRFFLWGFALLPLLWAVNCFYFWPVLRSRPSSSPSSFSRIRPYVLRSAIGFLVFAVLLSSWVLIFLIGGEHLFGPVWQDLVMYNLADRLGLAGWV